MTRQEVYDYVKKEYETDPEYLWARYPDTAVLRNASGKWYGIIMDVSKQKFGLDSDEVIDVLNVKANVEAVDFLITLPGIFRAYHMSKTNWVSVFLDGTASDDTIINLLSDSYEMTMAKKNKKL